MQVYVRISFEYSTVLGEGKGKGRERGTISVDQLHVQFPQLPQLLLIGPEHLMPKHVHFEHLAQYTIDNLRSLLVEDVFPCSLLPAARYPVRVLHQFSGGVG